MDLPKVGEQHPTYGGPEQHKSAEEGRPHLLLPSGVGASGSEPYWLRLGLYSWPLGSQGFGLRPNYTISFPGSLAFR